MLIKKVDNQKCPNQNCLKDLPIKCSKCGFLCLDKNLQNIAQAKCMTCLMSETVEEVKSIKDYESDEYMRVAEMFKFIVEK
jgi:hypothetical protein